MNNCFLHFFIRYTYVDIEVDEKTKEKKEVVKEIERKIEYSDIGGKCNTKNQWFYSFMSQFNNSNELAQAVLERLYNSRLKRSKNKDKYVKNEQKKYIIYELKDFELLINGIFAASDIVKVSYSKNEDGYFKLPMFFKETYYYDDKDNRKPYQTLSNPESMTAPLYRIKEVLGAFGAYYRKTIADESINSNIKDYTKSFRLNLAKQTQTFFKNNLERIVNAINKNPYSTESALADAKEIGALIDEYTDPADFVNKILFDKKTTNLLFAGSANSEHNKYLIFLSSIINQIQAHQLAIKLDETDLFQTSFLKENYLHTDLYNELLNKSMNEVYYNKLSEVLSPRTIELADELDKTDLFDKPLYSLENLVKISDELKNKSYNQVLHEILSARQNEILVEQAKDDEENTNNSTEVYSELYDYYKVQYPNATDEEIQELIQPDYTESETNDFVRKRNINSQE